VLCHLQRAKEPEFHLSHCPLREVPPNRAQNEAALLRAPPAVLLLLVTADQVVAARSLRRTTVNITESVIRSSPKMVPAPMLASPQSKPGDSTILSGSGLLTHFVSCASGDR
jgi:hypothetical protein